MLKNISPDLQDISTAKNQTLIIGVLRNQKNSMSKLLKVISKKLNPLHRDNERLGSDDLAGE